MTTVLITGANRGLGLEFCKQYATENWRVLACCREPENALELKKLAEIHSQLSIYALDVANFTQIDQLAQQLKNIDIDVLINNAGVYGDTEKRGFGQLNYTDWTQTLLINTQAPVKMAESFLPHLKRGQQKLIVSITSLMGSMTDNGSGGSILYRSSKAALNAAMKSIAIDLKPHAINVLILHPGWVQTDMGGTNAPLKIMPSIQTMRQTIANFKPNQTGQFLNYDGSMLPW